MTNEQIKLLVEEFKHWTDYKFQKENDKKNIEIEENLIKASNRNFESMLKIIKEAKQYGALEENINLTYEG